MAEAFLSLAAPDRKAILETAASQSGRPAFILEKDVWICWVLQTLFSIPGHHPMAFKGGTSLPPVDYLAREVLLEFGGRNTVEPNERHRIVPDLAEQFDSPDTTLPRK